MEKDYLKIISFYGLRNQLKKLSEEVYEFQEAVLMDDGSEESLKHICEERADIEVLLKQFDTYFDLGIVDVSEWIVKKVIRTNERIKEEKIK